MKSLVLMMVLLSSWPAYASLDANEQSLVKAVDADLKYGRQLLEKIVNINSGTMNFEGVRQVGDILGQSLEKIGFQTEWIDGKEFNRAGHLVASHGNRGVKLLLIGHLDTVFAKDSPFRQWQVIDDTHVMGPGITDMKGGDVIIIQAMKALKRTGLLDQMQIRIVMTGDEESRGEPHSIANKALIDAAKWADIALGFEDGDGNPETAVVARRGAIFWSLNVTGKRAHSSQIFRDDIGYGAILELSRILTEFTNRVADLENFTFNPGLMLGGTEVDYQGNSRGYAFGKTNVIAQTAMVQGGMRAMSPEQLAQAKDIMRSVLKDNFPHTQARIDFGTGYPPMAPRPENYDLLARYSSVSEDLGFGEVSAVNPRKAGAADISFTASHVFMALDGLGLMGDGGHTVEEVADMETFHRQTKRAAILMYRLSKAHDAGQLPFQSSP